MIDYGEYKGHKTLTITAANSKTSISFGLTKAMAILAHIDEIRTWVAQQTEAETMHEVTCPDCGDTWMWAADMPDMPYAPKEYSADARCPACKDADSELVARYPLAGIEIPDLSLPQLPELSEHTMNESRRRTSREYARGLGRNIARRGYATVLNAPNRWDPLPAICLPGPKTDTPASRKPSGLILRPGTMPGSAVKCAKQGGMFTDKQTAGPKPQGNGKLIELGQPLELKAQDFRTAEEKEQDQIKAEAALNHTLPGIDQNKPGIQPLIVPQNTRSAQITAEGRKAEEIKRRNAETKEPKYISVIDTAKLIRADLAKAYPDVKFSVRSRKFSMGTSIDIGWTDGPTVNEIEKLVNKYQSESFDGMTDSHTAIYQTDPETGERICYGATYIMTQRDYSRLLLELVAMRLAKEYHAVRYSETFTIEEHNDGSAYIKQEYTPDGEEARRLILAAVEKRYPFEPENDPEPTNDDNGAAEAAPNLGQPVEDAHLQERREAYEEKRQARIDRLHNAASKAKAESDRRFETAHKMGQCIPMGQPILVGHHSEKSDRAFRNRIDNHMRKGVEKANEAADLEARARAAEKNNAVSSDDPDGIDKLRVKVAKAQELQETMTAANKVVRNKKLSDEEKIAALTAIPNISEKTAHGLLEKDFAGRIGFPDYALRNNSGNIRRMEQRIEDLEKAATRTTKEYPFGDVVLTLNAEENRIQLKYPTKPDSDTIDSLRQHGFVFSKKAEVWQRKYNNSALWAAAMVLGLSESEQREFYAKTAESEEQKAATTLAAMKKASFQGCSMPQTENVIKWSPEQLKRSEKAKAELDKWFPRS